MGQIMPDVVEHTDKETLQEFATDSTEVCTDESLGYRGSPWEHKIMNHSVRRYNLYNGVV